MLLFMFEQNNAGGFFVEGLPQVLFVEADNEAEAVKIAEARGVDFTDGCPGCCGDRWYTPLRGSDMDTEGLEVMKACLYMLDNKIPHEVIWK